MQLPGFSKKVPFLPGLRDPVTTKIEEKVLPKDVRKIVQPESHIKALIGEDKAAKFVDPLDIGTDKAKRRSLLIEGA